MSKTAVVFAGGGLAGIAWEIGFLLGVQDSSVAAFRRIMAPRTTFIGTSAGSAVASAVSSGTPLQSLFDGQLAPDSAEVAAEMDMEAFAAQMLAIDARAASEQERRRLIGQAAVEATTVPAEVRRAAIEARLPVHTWPDRHLSITAIDTETGDLRVFDRESGVGIVDAVSASCAVPGVWPAVEIDGRYYTDGGVRSLANADLAAGYDPVLILIPTAAEFAGQPTLPDAELDALRPARVLPIFADEASLSAFGTNPLDPAARPGGARAGREQGRQAAGQVAVFLG